MSLNFPNIRNKRSNSITENNTMLNTYYIPLTGNLRKDYNNYGNLLKYFCEKSIWWKETILNHNELATLSNKNSLSLIKHYIDGTDYFTIKDLFLSHIQERPILSYKDFLLKKVYPNSFPVYLKPSHAYIGGGNGIYFFNNKHELDNFSIKLSPSLNYFFDSAISNPVKYNGKIWDCRTYMILYKKDNILYLYGGNRGFCRLESSPNFTNLSLVDENENINDYMIELGSKVVNDINEKFRRYFEKYFLKYIESTSQTSFIVLGVDSMLSNKKNSNSNIHPSLIKKDYNINFIEVNKSPVMLYTKNTIEGEITYNIFEELIDKILVNENFNNNLKSISLMKKYDISSHTFRYNKEELKKYYTSINEDFMKKRDKTLLSLN